MSRLHDRIEAELENLDACVALLPTAGQLPNLNELELAGVAGFRRIS